MTPLSASEISLFNVRQKNQVALEPFKFYLVQKALWCAVGIRRNPEHTLLLPSDGRLSFSEPLENGVVAHNQLVDGKRLARVEAPDNFAQRNVVLLKHLQPHFETAFTKSTWLPNHVNLVNRRIGLERLGNSLRSLVSNLIVGQIKRAHSLVCRNAFGNVNRALQKRDNF